jgi:hypothetical protein
MKVDYGVDLGVIKTNCPFCNPHPGVANTRKQRIEEMCKSMFAGGAKDYLHYKDVFDQSVWIIDKIDALDDEQ